MLYLVLLPAIPAIWMIARRSLGDAVIDVYLPALFLVPTYYILAIPHFIGFSASDAAIIPITVAAVIKYRRQWRWQRADLWLLLFAAFGGYSYGINYSTGLREFCQRMILAVSPYIVGKLLIEQEGIRKRVVRRMAWLSAIVALISIVEFRLGRNLFAIFYTPLFHKGPPNVEQVRHGFERVQGPFQHAIAAGMIFGSVWILALWLSRTNKQELGGDEPKLFGLRRSWFLMACAFAGMLMTMSIGPWMGAALAFAIAWISRAKSVKSVTIAVAFIVLIASSAGYSFMEGYTSSNINDAQSYVQEDAIYRRQLLTNYLPIAEAGGWFGWGRRVPAVPGQNSVDNEYLVLALMRGLLGLTMFVLLGCEAAGALIHKARWPARPQDFSFAITLLAVLAGIWLALGTVYLQAQVRALYYLFLGWGLAEWRFSADRAGADGEQGEPENLELDTPRIFA